jgi:hypothetical protein
MITLSLATTPLLFFSLGLLFVGIFTMWLAYYIYNRCNAKPEGQSEFRGQSDWKSQPIDIGTGQSMLTTIERWSPEPD